MPPCRVLVVDDEPDLLLMVEWMLTEKGYEVATASNGAEALQVLPQVEPDCVVLDLRMPVLDGWSLARELERRQLRIPLVAMTAARDAQAWCEQIKAAECLLKPFELADLLGCVERGCGQAGTAAG
jgi:CheY-like chemotaxis protein